MIERSHHELRKAFGDLLQGTVCKFAASVFDPISVRMASDLGFEVAIQGGSVASLQVLGAPDIALLTLDEYVEQVSRVGRASQIPIIGDADHGFGNALNVMRTVTELQKAGVAALTLEDTHLPAKYDEQSHVLIEREEAASKIYAARFARSDDALTIIARTNVAVTTLEDSIARTTAYEKAGADAICLVGVKDFQHLEALTAHLSVPIMLINYGNPALSDVEKLSAANVRIVVNGHAPYLSAIKATYEALREQSGTKGSEFSLPELLSKYTLSDNYREWAKTYLKSEHDSN
ncbi:MULTISPECIES: isocitrate lyase/PEP mutase family protein [unclassified Pseudomonas]|uniref:isocitrate lyase/PEP mutase family protein n=1 Tax=unclassified Pseudomonas TaxID=196821 RepID=UPI002A35B344|nr:MULTISPECIES: isocitrate lyase/phosphoenolpyruvate mutase family protein [unclassified Pseudomonas]MDX9669004.1 isocitrate lyase/phosphoenolpyruvate mutase family protein [Pseudomonas sp. P8_250]WPN36945.1 isocitrate lyase/phosphoenolpyruvate mutase family protein [Pseudomonas sp. P8_139]WPN41254.1 isocitrate lyase/phosphoenolpyruvate mutase family protein [Pseudomonas sp. P8_229]